MDYNDKKEALRRAMRSYEVVLEHDEHDDWTLMLHDLETEQEASDKAMVLQKDNGSGWTVKTVTPC